LDEKKKILDEKEQKKQQEQQMIFEETDVDKTKVETSFSSRRKGSNKNESITGERTRHNGLPLIRQTWDPLFQYRALFPFPWLSVVLFLLLFLSLMRK